MEVDICNAYVHNLGWEMNSTGLLSALAGTMVPKNTPLPAHIVDNFILRTLDCYDYYVPANLKGTTSTQYSLGGQQGSSTPKRPCHPCVEAYVDLLRALATRLFATQVVGKDVAYIFEYHRSLPIRHSIKTSTTEAGSDENDLKKNVENTEVNESSSFRKPATKQEEVASEELEQLYGVSPVGPAANENRRRETLKFLLGGATRIAVFTVGTQPCKLDEQLFGHQRELRAEAVEERNSALRLRMVIGVGIETISWTRPWGTSRFHSPVSGQPSDES